MSEHNLFASRLSEAMTLRGQKQVDLCEKTGIPKSALSQYLAGRFEPKQDRLWKLAQALSVSEAWLMGYEVPMERRTDELSDAIPAGYVLNLLDDLSVQSTIDEADTKDLFLNQLLVAYNEFKEEFTEDDIEDIILYIRMVAERRRRREARDLANKRQGMEALQKIAKARKAAGPAGSKANQSADTSEETPPATLDDE